MGLVQFTEEVSRLWRRRNSGEAAHIALGQRGENLAAQFLQRHNHRILYRNFRAPRGGEVDIVCRDKKHSELVFVEVKTRTSELFGAPAEAVDQKKRRLIIRGAMQWLRMLDMPEITYRFDIVEVVIGPPLEIRQIENAFPIPANYLR
jgi:putative endonuclease